MQVELVAVELEGRGGVLEVEAGAHLAAGLVDRVADLLHVNLGNDVRKSA